MRTIAADDASVIAVSQLLGDGAVLILPTDTIPGLSCRLSDSSARARIVAIKKVNPERPFAYLAASIDMVEQYVASLGCVSREKLEKAWPGPLTVILLASKAARQVVGPTIAMRVPAHPWLRSVIGALGEPVLSTSVNLAGQPPVLRTSELQVRFGSEVDGIVNDAEPRDAVASTLVDATGDVPRLVRAGAYAWAT